MKVRMMIALFVGVSAVACSQKYYPEMYEKAGEEAPVVVKTEKDTVLREPVLPADTVLAPPFVTPADTVAVADTTALTETIRETTDTYTSNGVEVTLQYHVVVGSFKNEVNAQNLLLTLQKQGHNATIAVNQNGLFRVFLYSTNTEADVRQALAKARATYPDAWMLKLAK